ncbi:(2Fe-2S)-binding protein [Lichenifustis flavocetrariae]|uniref:(2Fe-2S)-binding protein n=1 Tax=Lichenifustis flavocetrariae TaxID=2949735 RepID=A0AA41Z372_9HYPH|nr:2Fe-2S iron-sulfur cluster-binding protein [Lichenifustis flavocetrariae]MCW6509683.1 (2Fe-2S)-binding protein [Lichenifustis flavocetrariae]
MPLALTVNGEVRLSNAGPMTPLLDILREEFQLTGAKPVCREGFCGACMVLRDGRPILSCLTPAGLVEGSDICTIEGLSPGGTLTPLQDALESHDAVQCGMCFPGMVITLTHALRRTHDLTDAEVRQALVGNICRCTGYERIVAAALAIAAAHGPEAARDG